MSTAQEIYTEEELKEMVRKMQRVTSDLYPKLCATGCHTFIEFCGLMNEFIKVCEQAAQDGIQFPLANEHSGIVLPVATYNLMYIAEKLRCIFGPTIDANIEAKKVFARELLGIEWSPESNTSG